MTPSYSALPLHAREVCKQFIKMAPLADSHISNGGLMKRLKSSDKLKKMASLADDITVLKTLWFSKAKAGDHASRLEEFYAPQAHACKPHWDV